MLKFTRASWRAVVEVLRRVVPAARILTRFTGNKVDDIAVEVVDAAIREDVRQEEAEKCPPAETPRRPHAEPLVGEDGGKAVPR
jgi:hypothetical protein